MNKEQKFLNNCFFKEGKYGFKIALDPESLKSLKLVNGKYQIEAKKSRNGDKWYMVEDTWEPQGGFTKPTTRIEQTVAMLPKDDVWSKAKDWQVKNQPNGDFEIVDLRKNAKSPFESGLPDDDSGLPF